MKWIAIFGIAAALAGCASEEALLRKQALATEPDPAMRQLIADKSIRIGMTKDQVIASWGYPCGRCRGTRENSWGDTWEYNIFGTTSSGIGRGTYLFFGPDDRLRNWSD